MRWRRRGSISTIRELPSTKRTNSNKCEKCGKKFTFDDPDISFRAKTRIIHVHRSCGQKAGMY